jgi:hypothetical protein
VRHRDGFAEAIEKSLANIQSAGRPSFSRN